MNRDNNFIRFLGTLAVFIALETASLVLIGNNSIIQRYKIMGTVRYCQNKIWQTGENIRYYFNYKDENQRLSEENSRLRSRIALYESIDYYSDSLVESVTPYYSYVPATIIKKTTNKQHNYIIINKGSDSGVEEGMGVVTDTGIVGVVSSVSSNYSYVISFLNTTQSVSVRVLGRDLYGPMSWSGEDSHSATLRDIPIHKEIAIGDSIVTSGYSTIYPNDIPIGVISSMRNGNGLAYDVDIDLFADYNSIRYVNVVMYRDMDEIEKLEEQYE